jgi:hypothetical protein
MYTTIRHDLTSRREAWPCTLEDPCLLSGDDQHAPTCPVYFSCSSRVFVWTPALSAISHTVTSGRGGVGRCIWTSFLEDSGTVFCHKYHMSSYSSNLGLLQSQRPKTRRPAWSRDGDGGGDMICTMMEAAECMPYHQLLWQGLLSY